MLTKPLPKPVVYLAKKIEQAHVVWFEPSNQWVQFDEQQWLIFCFYIKNTNPNQVVDKLCKQFSLPKEQAIIVQKNIYDSIYYLLNPAFQLPSFKHNLTSASFFLPEKKKSRKYLFHGKKFTINYGSSFLEKYIHSPLAYLENNFQGESNLTLEVFPFEKRYFLRVYGKEGKILTADESGQVKRLLYIELTNYFYNKEEGDWMSFLHASAVRKNNEVLVLTSSGGSGKSTMAGLLQLNGFDFFSDDFVPVEIKSRKAFPFPAALCVKNDAISFLVSKGLELRSSKSGKEAYGKLTPKKIPAKACSMKKVVFIKYNKETELLFESISTLDALYRFLQEAWVGNDMKSAKKFISWFSTLQFYYLEYGNNEKAVAKLSKLMSSK